MKTRKILAMLLSLAMVIGLMTPAAMATEETQTNEATATEVASYDALVAAVANGGEIKLTEDIPVTEMIKVEASNPVILDLNGHSMTAQNLNSNSNFVLWVTVGDTVTINDSVGTGGIANSTTYGYAILNQGTLTVNGGSFTGDTALWNGYDTINATATLNGGTFNFNGAEDAGYSVGNAGTLTINSGVVVNDWLDSFGALTVNGGTIANIYVSTGRATVATAATTISGGTVTGTLYIEEAAAETATITGGTFSDLSVLPYLNTTSANDVTIKLANDVTIDDKINVTADLTIDGNNKKLTYTGGSDRVIDVASSTNGADLTVKNLTILVNGYAARGINYNTNGTLTVQNVTIGGTSPATYAINLPGSSDGATVNISDSNLTGCIALNIWGEGCTINVTDTALSAHDTTDAENYTAVNLNNDGTTSAEGTTLTITGGSITSLDENGGPAHAVSNATETGKISVSDTTRVTGVQIELPEYSARVVYEAYHTSLGCASLQRAMTVGSDDSNAIVRILSNSTENVTVTGAVVFDLNGKTMTGTITLATAGSTLTAADGLTVVSGVTGYNVDYVEGKYVLVQGEVTGVTLNNSTLSLTTGGNATLTATVAPAEATNKAVTWTSSNTGVATVDSNGKVTAVAAGSATITVTTADGGFTATCAVTVSNPSSGSSSSSSSSSSNTTSSTEKNPDGSTTTTTTNKTTGTVTETTKNTDGSSTTVETKKDGTVTTTEKTAEGVTSTVVENEDGDVTEVTATVPTAAANTAAKNDEPVTLPVQVEAVTDSNDAVAIEVNVPSKGATVEIPVDDVTPGTVVVIVDEDGNETIVPTSTISEDGVVVTLEGDATIKIIDNSKDFVDVPEDYTLADSIDFVSARGLFEGTTETTYTPHANTTIAQTMTVLARLSGEDFYGAGATTKGAEWAEENGLSDGTPVHQAITRQQMVVMMWKLAGMPASDHEIDHHTDHHHIDDHALVAMQWAVEHGILTGYEDGSLKPHAPASRAHVAAFTERYVNTIA